MAIETFLDMLMPQPTPMTGGAAKKAKKAAPKKAKKAAPKKKPAAKKAPKKK